MKASLKLSILVFIFSCLLNNLIAQELYSLANAANAVSEANATTDVSSSNANWVVTSVSSSPTAYNGTYSLKFTHDGPDNTSYYALINVTGLTIGDTYEVHFWANRLSGGNFQIILQSWRGWTADNYSPLINSTVATNTWYEYVLTGTASSTTASITVQANSNADTGNAIAIDNISIVKLGGEEPSTSPSHWTLDNQNLYYNDGNVGIGTSTPTKQLSIQDLDSGTGLYDMVGILIKNSSNTLNTKAGVQFSNLSGITAMIESRLSEKGSDAHGADLIFSTQGVMPQLRPNMTILGASGNVGIGTTSPDEKLSVNGNIHTKEVRVDLIGWSDFVFTKDYELPTLKEVEQHIQEKGHLKDIPSAKEVEENGILLGDMNAKLLQKIEELTLYAIEQEKMLKEQEKEILNQKEKVLRYENKVISLEMSVQIINEKLNKVLIKQHNK